MRYFYITFRSVTFAQRAERLLLQKNIHAGVMRTPAWMEEQGCGYALKVFTKDIVPAVDLLRESQILMRRVYVRKPDGQMEELDL